MKAFQLLATVCTILSSVSTGHVIRSRADPAVQVSFREVRSTEATMAYFVASQLTVPPRHTFAKLALM